MGIPLPSRYDDYEHMAVNFRGPGGKGSVKEVNLLVFGGIDFLENESSETYHMQIDMDTETFTITHLPKARLPHPDRFIDNQTMHVDSDTNVVTMVGKHSLQKINTGVAIEKLKWEEPACNLGYDKMSENQKEMVEKL